LAYSPYDNRLYLSSSFSLRYVDLDSGYIYSASYFDSYAKIGSDATGNVFGITHYSAVIKTTPTGSMRSFSSYPYDASTLSVDPYVTGNNGNSDVYIRTSSSDIVKCANTASGGPCIDVASLSTSISSPREFAVSPKGSKIYVITFTKIYMLSDSPRFPTRYPTKVPSYNRPTVRPTRRPSMKPTAAGKTISFTITQVSMFLLV
jgi:hypothetical protein